MTSLPQLHNSWVLRPLRTYQPTAHIRSGLTSSGRQQVFPERAADLCDLQVSQKILHAWLATGLVPVIDITAHCHQSCWRNILEKRRKKHTGPNCYIGSFKIYLSLYERQSYNRERSHRERERSPICGFNSPNGHIIQVCANLKLEPGTPPRSQQGFQVLGPSLAASQAHKQEAGSETGPQGSKAWNQYSHRDASVSHAASSEHCHTSLCLRIPSCY